MTPVRPELEARVWDFYYFLTERGLLGEETWEAG